MGVLTIDVYKRQGPDGLLRLLSSLPLSEHLLPHGIPKVPHLQQDADPVSYTHLKSADGISRQPEAEGKIRTNLMLTLVFIETAIIYALLVVLLVIFVI